MDGAARRRDALSWSRRMGGSLRWAEEGDVVTDETAAAAEGRVRRRFGRRRPNAAGGRQHAHQVKVTPEEEARLTRLAAAQRVTVSRLLLESALAARGETPTQRREAMVELLAVRRLLAAVSNNVNQIARSANAGREFPADAAGVLVGVRRVVGRLDETLDRLARP